MLKLTDQELADLEVQYPGIIETIRSFENAKLPACPHCQSEDTAQVNCGVVGYSLNIAFATTKFRLIPNARDPGKFWCNRCKTFFN